MHVLHSLPINMCVCVRQAGFLPGWLTCILLQKCLVKRSRTWGLSENSGYPSPFQPSTLVPYLSYILRWCLILFRARFLWFLVFEKAAYHKMLKEYILGDRRLIPNLVKLTLLEIGPIRYSFKKWLSFKILLSLGCRGGTHLLIPLGKWV